MDLTHVTVGEGVRSATAHQSCANYGDLRQGDQSKERGSTSVHPPRCGGAPSPPKIRKIAAVITAIVAPNTARRNIVNIQESVARVIVAV